MMNWKLTVFISIFICILFSVLILMTGQDEDILKNSENTEYNPCELSWEEIVERAKEEGSVIFSTWWAEAYFYKVAALFEEKYNINVEILIQDQQTITHRILLEKRQNTGTVDVYFGGSGSFVRNILDNKMLLSGMECIPGWGTLSTKDKTFQKNLYVEGIMVPIYKNQVAFLYNPDNVKKPPRSWNAFNLWIRENPGKFVFSALKDGSGEAFRHSVVYHLTGGADKYRSGLRTIDPDKVSNWNIAWEWFNNNREYYGLTGSNHDSISRIQKGEAWITPAFVDDTFIAMNSGLLDKKMKLYVPDFGLFAGSDAVGIVSNAPHRMAAFLFISFLIEKDTQLLMLDELGADCVRTDIGRPDNPLLSVEDREKAINHTDVVYYLYLASEFQKHVLYR